MVGKRDPAAGWVSRAAEPSDQAGEGAGMNRRIFFSTLSGGLLAARLAAEAQPAGRLSANRVPCRGAKPRCREQLSARVVGPWLCGGPRRSHRVARCGRAQRPAACSSRRSHRARCRCHCRGRPGGSRGGAEGDHRDPNRGGGIQRSRRRGLGREFGASGRQRHWANRDHARPKPEAVAVVGPEYFRALAPGPPAWTAA
jgi:hypothetical protein